ncbi:hypothetical protein PZ61_0201040 [Streptomyces sp. MNU77]|nr:hypothetical protein PZ61_0201040 [Streptomyces sp. MNU77]OWA26366.1 hypothetical protein B9W61_00940 [Streptomyces sp. CS057]
MAVTGLVATTGSATAASETRWGCKAKFYAMDVDQGGGTGYSSCPQLPSNRRHAVMLYCNGKYSGVGPWVKAGKLSTSHCAGGVKATAAYVTTITV